MKNLNKKLESLSILTGYMYFVMIQRVHLFIYFLFFLVLLPPPPSISRVLTFTLSEVLIFDDMQPFYSITCQKTAVFAGLIFYFRHLEHTVDVHFPLVSPIVLPFSLTLIGKNSGESPLINLCIEQSHF